MKRRSYWRPRAHRYNVVTRSKVRNQRIANVGVVLTVLALGVAAFFVAKHFPRPHARWTVPGFRIPLPLFLRLEHVSVTGLPEALSRQVLTAALRSEEGTPQGVDSAGEPAFSRWSFWEPYRIAKRLNVEFPCLRPVAVKRYWPNRTVEFQAALRDPLAIAVENGRPAGWLAEGGAICKLPAGTYPEASSWPVVEIKRAPGSEYSALAELVAETSKEGALPSPLSRLEFRSAEEGWEAWLGDGTHLLWGNLSWTEMKLSRLKEVFSDANRKIHPGAVVDLRYFQDGKIMVRAGSAPFSKSPKPAAREILK